MIVGNTVTIDRRVEVDIETGGEVEVYTLFLSYFDGDGRRDVSALLDLGVGAVAFGVAEALAKRDFAGRAASLAGAAAEADALSKEGE